MNTSTAATPDSFAVPGGHSPRSLRIMVVDDSVDAASTIAMLLELYGHVVAVEHSAESALVRAYSEPQDAFLLDIGLPDMDGCALARELRAHPETANSLLVALTGYNEAADRKRCDGAGFDHHLAKPVDIDKLLSLLAGPAGRAPSTLN